ncbi:MAG: hypothetical protein NVSMB52_07820 [Chloroflexota bacterium]
MGTNFSDGPPQPADSLLITLPVTSRYDTHAGYVVELQTSDPPGYIATADSAYLQLIDSGVAQTDPLTQFWRWKAIASGETVIIVDRRCRLANPPCNAPTVGVRVHISA